ncbi:MAG: hypothetical protein HGJ94_15555 [Desulfosarcina sp.]|nr:hypothetical protein [Desulfosarcina sp.]
MRRIPMHMADWIKKLEKELGCKSVYAYNAETFGPEGTLGRESDREVVLTRYLYLKLVELNPDLPQETYQETVRRITETSIHDLRNQCKISG